MWRVAVLQPRPVNHDLGSKPFFFHYNKFEGKPISHNNGFKAGIFLGMKKKILYENPFLF